ncbi:MAG: class II aldolase/adducin family protein [Betaproteobacteria bacterium]
MNAKLAPDIRSQVSAEEWQVRVDLAACYRLVALYRWDDMVFTHISARVPAAPGQHDPHHFLINPYGMMFEEITASSLVKVDENCAKVLDSPYPVNPAGFVIHSAIHFGRPDVQCVLHTHTPDGVAVAAQKGGLLPISQQATISLASLAYHGYEGIAVNDAEKPRLVDDLGNRTNFILRNHGLLTVGPSVADAFLAMFNLQRACEIQIRAQGAPLIEVDPRIIAGAKAASEKATKGMGGQIAWPALLRKLDRLDPAYKS